MVAYDRPVEAELHVHLVTERRCELSDLPVSMCGCRVHRPADDTAQHPAPRGEHGKVVAAQYSGTCVLCTDRVGVGDPIRHMAGGGWAHEECVT